MKINDIIPIKPA